MPTEQELRDNPGQQFQVGETNVWFEDFGDDSPCFFAADAMTGDCGDGFDSYDELLASM